MANRCEKREFNDNTEAIGNLLHSLNQFCFHDGGGDDNCVGCCFKEDSPCPLGKFYVQLAEKLPR